MCWAIYTFVKATEVSALLMITIILKMHTAIQNDTLKSKNIEKSALVQASETQKEIGGIIAYKRNSQLDN